MDITDIILADHEDQRRMFARLDDVDRSDAGALGALWTAARGNDGGARSGRGELLLPAAGQAR